MSSQPKVTPPQRSLKVVFAGTPDVALPTLRALLTSHTVVGVITRRPKRQGRKRVLTPSPVGAFAKDHGLPLFETDRPTAVEINPWLEEIGAELGVVVAYGAILGKPVLQMLPLGWINLHFSALPDLRGAAPVQRAIWRGDLTFSTSVFALDEGMDTGPVATTESFALGGDVTSGDVLEALSLKGADQTVKVVDDLARGTAHFTDQDTERQEPTYAPRLSKRDAFVDFRQPAEEVAAQIRACTPTPGAWTSLPDGKAMKLGPALVVEEHMQAGAVRFVGGDVLVGCSTGAIVLGQVAPAGKRLMDASSWWRGARLEEGTLLGQV